MQIELKLYRNGKPPLTLEENLEIFILKLEEVVSFNLDGNVASFSSKNKADLDAMGSLWFVDEPRPTWGVFEKHGATLFLDTAKISEMSCS